jgi:hypothetical protein
MAEGELGSSWHTVRCVFRWGLEEPTYEERVTIWRAATLNHAVELAESEAKEYALSHGFEYIGLAQGFSLFEGPESGAEVFSLLRDSELAPGDYIDRFFDTGREHQQEWKQD